MSYAKYERGHKASTEFNLENVVDRAHKWLGFQRLMRTPLLRNTKILSFNGLGSIVHFNQIRKYRISHGDCVLPKNRGIRDQT
ncbi:hypothetical protein T4D_14449 [Trichinella pseudospiralis]|uniref:Uncharacterized protein n=1 Tax=Trichinella pseudospiralis TaxID=6337 RepID=A0A0V1FGW5_TRIPS|nr:hypothetical protein T4D_14449 [Trichinella pseudospiralis]